MNLKLEKEVIEKFPDFNLGVVVIKGMENNRNASLVISKMMDDIVSYVRNTYLPKSFRKEMKLANWRKVYNGKYEVHSAVESMMHDVLLMKPIKRKNNLVDLYRFIMLKHMLPVGGDDLDKVKGNISVKIGEGHEILNLAHGDKMNVHEGELIVTDSNNVLGRGFSWYESDKTKITHYSKNAVVLFSSLFPFTVENLEEVMAEFVDLVKTFCGGRITTKIVNIGNPKIRI